MTDRSFRRTFAIRLLAAICVAFMWMAIAFMGRSRTLHQIATNPTAYLGKQRMAASRGFWGGTAIWFTMVGVTLAAYEGLTLLFQWLLSPRDFQRAFYARGIKRGGVLMLRPAVALDVIQRAQDLGVPLAGVDGFLLTPQSVVRKTEASLDLDHNPPPEVSDCWQATRTFVMGHVAADLYFAVRTEQ